MNFKQLEIYVNVIKYRSFSRAAEEVFLSQPTVSTNIQSLEAECGVTLLMRSTREVVPTRAGKVFYEYANEVLSLRDKALRAVHSSASSVSGTLEIAASTVPAQYILPGILAGISAEYPELFFSLRQSDSREVVRCVSDMEAEIGIIGTQIEDNNCLFEPFIRDELVVITPNTSEYEKTDDNFSLRRVCREPFLVREGGSGTRREMEHALLRAGVEPSSLHVTAQFDSTESIKHAVAEGLGISIISRIAARDYEKFGLLRVFDLDKTYFERQLYFVFRKNWPLSAAAEILMRSARQSAADAGLLPRSNDL